MKKLNEKEIKQFAKKYLSDWTDDIKEVSVLTYRHTKEYLVNGHYLIIVSGFKVNEKDLQEL